MESNSKRQTVFAGAKVKAGEHRWNRSVEAQRDLGPDAEHEWYRVYYPKYVRGCLIEHITGGYLYEEFNESSFNIVQTFRFKLPSLTDRILDLLQQGKENLDIIQWAMDAGENIDKVIEFLEAVDVNACRFPRPAEESTAA
jgi:hypothetical protein